MTRKAFTEHPEFFHVATLARAALVRTAITLGCEAALDTAAFEVGASRLVDDMTKLLLRAYDAKDKA